MTQYDLIVIGTGPGGLTAALYAARYKLNVLVIGKLAGGTAGEAYEIFNFPSHEKISGLELMKKMTDQIKAFGVEIKYDEVLKVKKEGEEFKIITNKEKYSSKKIILASGSNRKKVELPNEKELTGKGISYCATCDAGFYKDKVVGVVGGSDSALTAALLLAKFATKVYIIYRKDKFFRAEPSWIEEVKKNEKIAPMFNSNVLKLTGKDHLEEVEILEGKERKTLKLDGLFFEIGSVPGTKLAKGLNIELDGDYIMVDKNQRTNVEGFFAAGDVTNNPLKQIITACAEGAVAAYTAYGELEKGKTD